MFYLYRYIMTSEFTLAPTKKFFEENHYFGLEPANIIMFEQRMIPAVTFDGKVIMQAKGKIAMAPGRCKEKYFSKTPNNYISPSKVNKKIFHVCFRWEWGSVQSTGGQ